MRIFVFAVYSLAFGVMIADVKTAAESPELSIVVPFYNEAENIEALPHVLCACSKKPESVVRGRNARIVQVASAITIALK